MRRREDKSLGFIIGPAAVRPELKREAHASAGTVSSPNTDVARPAEQCDSADPSKHVFFIRRAIERHWARLIVVILKEAHFARGTFHVYCTVLRSRRNERNRRMCGRSLDEARVHFFQHLPGQRFFIL